VPGAALASVAALAGGQIQSATEMAERDRDRAIRPVLPVLPGLDGLLRDGGLRGGNTVTVEGSLTLLLALLAATSRHGWVAAVGMPQLGVLAAAELGVHVERLALVPRPGSQAADVVAALLDGCAIVAVASDVVLPGGQRGLSLARRLSARARHRGAVLMPWGGWPAPDVQLRCDQTHWDGLGPGYGHLVGHEIAVDVRGRGGASRPTHTRLRFPLAAPHTADKDRHLGVAVPAATNVS
jgi:hypothetical protein